MQDPLAYLSGLNSTVIHLGLKPVSRLLGSLGNPHKKYPSIIIGGTNGKGSIAAMTASILRMAGLRVGLYTSPHLIDLRERINVAGRMISPEDMRACIEDVRAHLGMEEVTYFEFLTAMAFLHFWRKQVDVAVLEVGMGGRLDATNVVTPVVSVISNICLEHRAYLGNSLEEIAREKAGIIKTGGTCVTAAKQKQVVEVFRRACRAKGAKLYRIGSDIKVRRSGEGMFSYRGIHRYYRGLSCPLRGRHQLENAAAAIAAAEIFAVKRVAIDDRAVYQGIAGVHWEGRLEILRHAPTLVVDGGHNPAGITVLCRALKEDFSYKRLILVFGVLDDKDYAVMLKKLLPLADSFIITRPAIGRAVPPAGLLPFAGRYRKRVRIVDKSDEALRLALSQAGKDDLVCVTGSLYLIGEVKQAFSVWGTR